MPVINMETSANAPMVVSPANEEKFAKGGRFIHTVKCVNMSADKEKSVLTKYSV
jgi:hypothetical protein